MTSVRLVLKFTLLKEEKYNEQKNGYAKAIYMFIGFSHDLW